MAKEKTPFEKTAAALKVMGKKIAAKKNEPRRELQCVWIAHNSTHAVATDGYVLACLDLNHWDNLSRGEFPLSRPKTKLKHFSIPQNLIK